MPYCIVKKCNSHRKKKELKIILHCFKKDKVRIKQWLMSTGQYDESDVETTVDKVWLGIPTTKYRICSMHFSAEMYQNVDGKMKLKKDAFPSIFPTGNLSSDFDNDHGRKKLCTEQNRKPSLNLSNTNLCNESNTSKTISFHSSMQTENTSVLSAGEDMSELSCITENSNFSEPTSSQSFVQSQKKHTWSRGVMTDFNTNTKNKKIGTLPFFGCHNKKIQHCPKTKNVGIQCDLFSSLKNLTIELTKENQKNSTPDKNDDIKITDVSQSETPISTICSQESSVNIEMDEFDISYNPNNDSNIENDDSVFDNSHAENFYKLQTSKITSAFSGSQFGKERKFLVFESCLDNLLAMVPCKFEDCNSSIYKVKKNICGSCLSVYAICKQGHHFLLWQSQPKIGNCPIGNVLIASSSLCSGSNFLKIESFLKLLGMISISKTTYYKYQKNYIFPAIDYHWQLEQKKTISQLSGKEVCLSGDRQCDSPGFNAKYCTYSFMELKTKKIVGFAVEQLTPGSSSVSLEGKAFVKALDDLLDRGLNVSIICTDRHVTIRKILSEKYNKIIHQFDVWHMAESVGAKISVSSKKKGCSELSPWIPTIKNHLWWASANCDRNSSKLKEQWSSVLCHVINVHQWHGCEHYKECKHSPISETSNITRKWLRNGSCAYKELKDIVLRKTWLRDIERLTLFCHTGNLEIFHSTALKYKPKRNHFCIDAMVARTQLSILEHNSNLHDICVDLSNSDQPKNVAFSSQYSKARGQWILRTIYEARRQDFVHNIYNHIFSALKGDLQFHWTSKSLLYP